MSAGSGWPAFALRLPGRAAEPEGCDDISVGHVGGTVHTQNARTSRFSRALLVGVLLSGALIASCSAQVGGAAGNPPPVRSTKPPVYLHYYLWWSTQHWHDKLGSSYPYTAQPLPVPGSLGADGCTASVGYPGATIVDIPSEGLYDQDSAATFDRHIAAAAAAGVRGFAVAWQGTGSAAQAPSSSSYDARLDLLVQRVDAYNATHATHFNLALDMSAFGDYSRPSAALVGDLTYFANRYAGDPAFANDFSAQPLAMILDSRKYTGTQVRDIAAAVGTRLFLISDDTNQTWTSEQQYFSGASWYWSSQNPYTNPQSGSQVKALGDQVHAAHKLWFAPFAPGFNATLTGHSACTPRDGTATLSRIWSMNAQSRPDAWFGISWNEFFENTYLEPSAALGSSQLDMLRQLIANQ